MSDIVKQKKSKKSTQETEEVVMKKEKKDKKEKKEKKVKEAEEVVVEMEADEQPKRKEKKDKGTKRKAEEEETKEEDEEEESSNKKHKSEADEVDPEEAYKTKDANGNPPLVDFPISQATLERLRARGITHAFPIQAQTFKAISEGKDVVGRARTGTGKTLAFGLPIIEKLLAANKTKYGGRPATGRAPRALVLAPTRELAQQVNNEFEASAPELKTWCMYGGSPYSPQEAALRRGLDVVVGTCGRIGDLLDKGTLKLHDIEHIILDEADEMLNMGFADDVEKILGVIPREGRSVQTLLFSATLPAWVQNVAKKYLAADKMTIDLVGNTRQEASTNVKHIAIPCHWSERGSVLGDVISVYAGRTGRTIIFTETKKEANELAVNGGIKADTAVLHGDIAQNQREITLQGFREGKFQCLIATDVAARGIDIPGVELVIQCEPTNDVETYVHRAGRTGRAGQKGTCITFYTPKQVYFLQQIERKARVTFLKPGIPQQADIIRIAADDARKLVSQVHKDVVPLFAKTAEDLIEEFGGSAENALAAALAQISGHSQPIKARSLLCSATGYVTVMMQTREPIRGLGYIWAMIRRFLFEDADDKVKGMRMLADQKGALFDIPAEKEDLVIKNPGDSRCRISIPTELPQMVTMQVERPPERRWGRGGASNGGGFRGGASSGGGFRGRGGAGRGASRGRGGGRGRGRGGY